MKNIVIIFVILTTMFGTIHTVSASEFWICLVDLSKSIGDSGEDSALSRNIKQVEAVIGTANKGDQIMVLGFGRRSNAILLEAQMPTQAGPMNKHLKSTRLAANKKLEENLNSRIGQVDRSKTDLHGGILKASRIYEEKGKDSKKKLFIFSDMLDTVTFGFSMKKLKVPEAHKDLWKKARSSTWPNLQNVSVAIHYSPSVANDFTEADVETATRELKSFWAMYINKCGGELTRFETTY
jgi:hypothetical protein